MENSKSILLVDDQVSLLLPLREALQSQGWEAAIAGSAEEALQMIQRQAFRIILTDYEMPGMNGVELIRQAGVLAPESKFLLMSGAADEKARLFCAQNGIALLQKPFSLSILISQLD